MTKTATKKNVKKVAPAKAVKATKAVEAKAAPVKKGKKEATAAPVKKPVEVVAPKKGAKPYPQGSTVLTVGSGKAAREVTVRARAAVVLSALQSSGIDVPLGKKDLMRVISRSFNGAPGQRSETGIDSGASGGFNDSVVVLQGLGLCRRMSATEAGIEGGLGLVAMLTPEGAKVSVPDACKLK